VIETRERPNRQIGIILYFIFLKVLFSFVFPVSWPLRSCFNIVVFNKLGEVDGSFLNLYFFGLSLYCSVNISKVGNGSSSFFALIWSKWSADGVE